MWKDIVPHFHENGNASYLLGVYASQGKLTRGEDYQHVYEGTSDPKEYSWLLRCQIAMESPNPDEEVVADDEVEYPDRVTPEEVETGKQLLEEQLKRFEADFPEFDKEVDYEHFPEFTVNQRLEAVPNKFMETIQLEELIITMVHQSCTMKKRPSDHAGGWQCGHGKRFPKCLSDIKKVGGEWNSKGIDGWRCEWCD